MPTTKTISTPEEVIYTPEDTLPAVPAAEVKQLRALNTNGESVNVTPDELAKTDVRPTRNYVTDGATTNTAYTWYSTTAHSPNANPIGIMSEQLKIGDWVCLQADIKTSGEVRYNISLGTGSDIQLFNTGGKFVRIFTARQIKTQAELNSFSLSYNSGGALFSVWIESGATEIKNRLVGIGNQSVDWFPAVGIDYSLLTEQAVPGEFWANRNGIGKKQVYTRTFVITTNPAGQGQLLMTGIDILIDTRISYNYPQTIMSGSTLELMYTYAIDTGSGGFYLTTLYPSFAGKATVVSIKYTKR